MIGTMLRRAALSALVLSASLGTAAKADAVADFYKGRTITILSGFGAGGMYGIYSHVIADHMPKHIPGHPKMIAQFMPGAGGVKAPSTVNTRRGPKAPMCSHNDAEPGPPL